MLAPRAPEYELGAASSADYTWQDVSCALQGVDSGKLGFMLFVYGNDPSGRHNFFAGLFMEVMERAEVRAWMRHREQLGVYYKAIETMCLLTIIEWGEGKKTRFTDQTRAQYMGVSRATWARKYKLIYQTILKIPQYWQDEVMRIVNKRLR